MPYQTGVGHEIASRIVTVIQPEPEVALNVDEPIAVEPLRGSPERITNHMETFQMGLVRTLVAASGSVAAVPEIDEGVDLVVSHRSVKHVVEARLEVQLKSTRRTPGKQGLRFKLERERYDYFRTADPTVSKIVVVMSVPASQNDWVHATATRLKVRNAAYWVNLDGAPETDAASITLYAPSSQIFDDVALCGIMERIGRGDKP